MHWTTRIAASLIALSMFAGLVSPGWGQPKPPPPTERELIRQGAQKVMATQLRTLLLGNTMYSLHLPTGNNAVTWYRDERTRIVVGFKGEKVTRLWWLEGDKLCHEPHNQRAGHTCYRFFTVAGQFRVCGEESSTCDHVMRFVPGNPEGLAQ